MIKLNEMHWRINFVVFLLLMLYSVDSQPHGWISNSPFFIQWNNVTLPQTLKNQEDSEVCTFIVAGASWDGHFKAWQSRGYWLKLAELLYPDPRYNVGYILYNDEALPLITMSKNNLVFGGNLIWDRSPPSFDVQAFYRGKLVDNKHTLDLRRTTTSWNELSDMELHEIVSRICSDNQLLPSKFTEEQQQGEL